MKFTITTTASAVSAGLKPGIYDVQNSGDVDLYWGRTADTATEDAGQLFAVEQGDEIFIDGRPLRATGAALYFVAKSGGAAGEVRLAFKRPA